MGVPNPLVPISASLPITQDGKLPNPDFIIQLNNALAQINGQIASLQTITQQNQANATAAAIAQQTANTPPTVGATTSGSTTVNAANVTSTAWLVGPVVNLTGVSASNFRANVTLAYGASPSIAGGIVTGSGLGTVTTANCEFRIRENPANVIVYPPSGQAVWIAVTYYGGGSVVNNAQSNLASFSVARVTTGAISYQLELLVDTAATSVNDVNLYLFVNRT